MTLTQTHFTDEIHDSVHSLEVKKQGYYTWKQENVTRHTIETTIIEGEELECDSPAKLKERRKSQKKNNKRSSSGAYMRDSLEKSTLLKKGSSPGQKSARRQLIAAEAQSSDVSSKSNDPDFTINKRTPANVTCPMCNKDTDTVVTR